MENDLIFKSREITCNLSGLTPTKIHELETKGKGHPLHTVRPPVKFCKANPKAWAMSTDLHLHNGRKSMVPSVDPPKPPPLANFRPSVPSIPATSHPYGLVGLG